MIVSSDCVHLDFAADYLLQKKISVASLYFETQFGYVFFFCSAPTPWGTMIPAPMGLHDAAFKRTVTRSDRLLEMKAVDFKGHEQPLATH